MTKRILIGILAGAMLLGCEGETGVRLVIRTDIAVPTDLDAVTVTVFAGAPSTARFERQNTFDDLTATDFGGSYTLTVGVTSGSTYSTWVLFRVQGILVSDVVVERWVLTEFSSGEIREIVVDLQNACRGVPCPAGQECVDAACNIAARPAGWLAECGDGILDTTEECDDGLANSDTAADACREDCTPASCGDDVIDTGEHCDDGNTLPDDGCSPTCRTEGPECGDLNVDPGEECDDGNTNAGDGCENNCQFTCDTDTDCADTDQCTDDVCEDVALGQNCTHDPDTGATCDDGNDCTTGETCDASADCTGGTNTCECDPLAADTCEADSGDDDPCNGTLICDDATSTCIVDDATVLSVDDLCDNGVFCDGADTCQGGPIACTSPGDPCETCQTCDETLDACPTDTGSCFIDSACYADGDDDPTNACQECASATSQTAWTPVASGGACDDGDACTTGETCDGAGACTGGTGVCTCSPTADTCEADHGNDDPCDGTLICTATLPNVCEVDPSTVMAVDDACDDGLDCNGADTCQTGTSDLDCTPSGTDPCLSCETCAETFPGHTCAIDSGNCIIDAACVARGATEAGNVCHVCDDLVSTTAWTNATDGTACDDTLFCNGADTCTAGACTHVGDPCTAVTCYGACDEVGDVCPVATGCYIGAVCYAEGADNPANECQECVAATSATAWTDKADTTACDDADVCTVSDECTSGACAGTAGTCTASPVVAGTNVTLCITDAACTALEGACTSVNAPASWTTAPWDAEGNPLTHCTAGSYWVVDLGTFVAGTYCYRFRPNASSVWYNDPLNADSGPDRCSGDNSQFIVP